MERLPGRSRRPGPAATQSWSRTSAMRRSRASASSSARGFGTRWTSASTLQFLDPKTNVGEPDHRHRGGDRLPFSAEEKGGGLARVHVPVASWRAARLYGRYQWSYNGDVAERRSPTRSSSRPTQISDFKFGIEADTWEVYAYVDNLGNERAVLFDQDERAARDDHDQHAANVGHRLHQDLGRQLSRNWRRERDSNPRRAFDPYTLSRGAPSTTRPSLRLGLKNAEG